MTCSEWIGRRNTERLDRDAETAAELGERADLSKPRMGRRTSDLSFRRRPRQREARDLTTIISSLIAG
jgi:hypothetical protein